MCQHGAWTDFGTQLEDGEKSGSQEGVSTGREAQGMNLCFSPSAGGYVDGQAEARTAFPKNLPWFPIWRTFSSLRGQT